VTTQTPGKPIEVLLAEDNPGDIRLTREAFKRGQIRTNLSVASNGEEALAFLRRQGKYTEAARPDLILLDLNMPRKDGRAVLTEIKKDPALDCIPVIVLTSSAAEEDVVKSYKLHASCYISKPFDVSKFYEVIRSIEQFWLSTARLPKDCKTSSELI
jgi:two-component system, chemotaxis family, response regulator Rcp1